MRLGYVSHVRRTFEACLQCGKFRRAATNLQGLSFCLAQQIGVATQLADEFRPRLGSSVTHCVHCEREQKKKEQEEAKKREEAAREAKKREEEAREAMEKKEAEKKKQAGAGRGSQLITGHNYRQVELINQQKI